MSLINPITGKLYSNKWKAIEEKSKSLPVAQPKVVSELKEKIFKNDILIFTASTGAGKSVRIPVEIARMFDYKANIAMTQPRTLNTATIASALADRFDVELGTYVGYKYHGNVRVDPEKTKVTLMVDAIFASEFANDPEKYDVVLIDEVHERNINIDLILALIKNYLAAIHRFELPETSAATTIAEIIKEKEKIARLMYEQERTLFKSRRKDKPVKFVLLSATVDPKKFIDYFSSISGVKIDTMHVEGRTFPIKHVFLTDIKKQLPDYTEKDDYKAIVTKLVDQILKNTDSGDIMVFVPTKSVIDQFVNEFTDYYAKNGIHDKRLLVGGLFRGMPERQQIILTDAKIYLEQGYTRKLVFATPIAETGVTVDGIIYVIETGVANLVALDQKTGIQIQQIGYINKSSATQRCGRAGRTRPGVCFHLYTEEEYNKFKTGDMPEIYRSNLYNVILHVVAATGGLIRDGKMSGRVGIQQAIAFMRQLIDPIDPNILKIYIGKMYRDHIFEYDSISAFGEVVYFLRMEYDLALLIANSFLFHVQQYFVPIVALMALTAKSPANLFSDPEKMIKYRNKYGDPIAYILIFTHFVKTFYSFHKNSSPTVFNDALSEWCKNNGFVYEIFKYLTPTIEDIQKKIKEIKRRRKTIYVPTMRSADIKQRQDIRKIIVQVFAKTYADNRAAYVPYQNAYVLPSNEKLDSKFISKFMDFSHRPSFIGFASLSNINQKMAASCMFPILFEESNS